VTNRPELGKNIFNAELARGKNASEALRRALRQLVEEEPGPQVRAILMAKAALALSELEAVLNELDKIGRNARNTEKKEL
jgi:hypothetical protein